MPEEVSPESKLYVKEEIEKTRKEFKEDIKEVQSKTTRTFTTVALVVGLLTGLSIYGSVTSYISTTIRNRLGAQALADFEKRLYRAQEFVADANVLRDKIATYETDANAILSSQVYNVLIGTIVPYGGKIESTSGDPCQVKPGWFFCNGASLDRKEYKELFDVIGVAFSAPTSDTFNLPDLRGRFVRGVDHGTGRDPDARLRKAGNKGVNKVDEVGSVQDDAFASHSHSLEKGVWKHYRSFSGASGSDRPLKDIKVDNRDVLWIRKTQESGGKETRPKNVYVNWIIKAR
jgi:hypothetical protein